MNRALHPHERLSVYGPIGATVERRLAMLRPVPELAVIFRSMIGDLTAQAHVTIEEVSMYEPAETFGRFLEVNRLPVFEEVLR